MVSQPRTPSQLHAVSLHTFDAIPLLGTLSPTGRRAVRDRSTPRHTAAGETLFRQGEPADELALLLRGRVTTRVHTVNGRIVATGTWHAPCALDKIALLDRGRHTCSAYADVDCTWRSLPRDTFDELVDDVPALRRHVLAVLAHRAGAAQDAFVEAVTSPVGARLARWLLREAADSGHVVVTGTQDDMAQLLGVTRVTMNRALRALEADGLIARSPGVITLIAPEALAKQAGGEPPDGASACRRLP